VAVLELGGDPPSGAEPVGLVATDDLWGHSFRAFGFPLGHPEGIWGDGVIRGLNARGWLQIEDAYSIRSRPPLPPRIGDGIL